MHEMLTLFFFLFFEEWGLGGWGGGGEGGIRKNGMC